MRVPLSWLLEDALTSGVILEEIAIIHLHDPEYGCTVMIFQHRFVVVENCQWILKPAAA